MEPIKEVFADIRNKLQPCKTVLEAVLLKKNPSVHLIEIAIKNIEQIEKSIDDYENK